MLIVSIQNFKKNTQNIVNNIDQLNKIFAIRTDTPIQTKYKIIGLKKNINKYYITTKIKDIEKVAAWSDYVAIDCRSGNRNLKKILQFCKDNNIKIVADIATKNDIDYLTEYRNHISYIATTFCFNNLIKDKCEIIAYANQRKFAVIAEGGFNNIKDIRLAMKYGAKHICIGNAIFNNYMQNVSRFIGYCYAK